MNPRQLFLQHVAQTSPFPQMLEIERGAGVFLYSPEGKAYLDVISGIGVSCLGHCHPEVVDAVREQVGKYMHTQVYGEFVLTPQVQLAKLLSQQLPDPLDSVYFVNSGSEATEGAMKLAKKYTGRGEIIACYKAYHGSTHGSASLMNPNDFCKGYYPMLPGIRHIEFNREKDLDKISDQTACVIVETVQGEWGIRPPALDYLKKLRQKCDETGALLVLDEIQAGMGRTGHLFAFEAYGVVPDVILLAKGLGGGMPIGVFIAPKAIMQALADQPILGHITTFGGHPVNCAAALATLNVLLDSDLIAQVKFKEQLFRKLLVHPAIREIRSAGLLMAVELLNSDLVQATIKNCFEKGLITDFFLFNDRSFRIAPPLIINEEEIRKACGIILESIEEAM